MKGKTYKKLSGLKLTPLNISIVFLFVLFIFSIFAWRERMFFIDPAWVTFNIINTNYFCFSEHRYGAFITQGVVLLGATVGLSLKSILILYSASFNFFYLAAGIILGYVWKQNWLTILLAVYFSMFVTDVFYWPNNEVHQGVTWMFLFLGFYSYSLSSKINPYLKNAILALLAFFAISSHLIVAIPLVLLWIYYHSELFKNKNDVINNKSFLIYTTLLLLFILIKYQFSLDGWYDGGKLEPIKTLSIEKIISAFYSGQSSSFSKLLVTHYWLSIPILFYGLYYLISEKKYLKTTLVISFTLGYYALICLTYSDSFHRGMRWYFESEWMALSIIISLPIIYEIYNRLHVSKTFIYIISFFFIIRFCYIANGYFFFHHRYQQLEKVTYSLYEKNIPKALIKEEGKLADEKYLMSWGLPVESMMLADVNGYKNPVTFKIVDKNFKASESIDSFYSCFKFSPNSILDKKYFIINTTRKYETLNGLDSVSIK